MLYARDCKTTKHILDATPIAYVIHCTTTTILLGGHIKSWSDPPNIFTHAARALDAEQE